MKKSVLVAVILCVAALSFVTGRWLIPGESGDGSSGEKREVLYYVDPMNPGFRSEEPGTAPCGMPLEPVYAVSEERGGGSVTLLPPGVVRVNPTQQQAIGVRTAPVGADSFTHTLRLYGQVIPDENLTYRLNASTAGWIREVSDVTTGDIVQKGQLLAQALAPSYYNAQVTFLIAMDNLDRIQEQLGGQLRQNQADIADNQIRVAVQALQNLGITDFQVEELANTRKALPYLQVRAPTKGVVLERNITLNEWLKAGDPFYTVADIGRVWVYADVYEDEARHLYPGMKVKVRHEQMDRTFDATVSRVLPLFDPVAKTLRVRLDVPNPDYDLRPDMFVDVQIPITMPPSLHVPADAVIDSGMRSVIYVDLGGGVFEPRTVATGWRLGREVQITGGLMPAERIVVSGNFLIDSESRMRASASETGESRMVRDPVCGMYVDADLAERMGWTVTHGGRTFYFCMDECRDKFESSPDKYLSDVQEMNMEDVRHGPMPGKETGWLKTLEAGAAGKHSDVQSEPSAGTFTKSLTKRGIVDWDGVKARNPEAPARDWTGWGKFPGARYLGLGDDPKKRKAEKESSKQVTSGQVQESPSQ